MSSKDKRRFSREELIEMRKDWRSIPFTDFYKKWGFKHGMVIRSFKAMNKMLREAGLREAE